jgi:hypothetical protein
MTLWKDLIDIPEHHEDWVLKLNEGLEDDHRGSTVDNYVVTDSLAERFDQALNMIQSGLGVGGRSKTNSRGAFLHGSFGSGKSHFMAILGLLLEGYAPARELENLTGVVTDHHWMDDVSLLRLPFHMIGKQSMEQAVFVRYIEWLNDKHPTVDAPVLYATSHIIQNAEELRQKFGDDERFIDILNGANDDSAADSDSSSRWGPQADTGWTIEKYENARDASENDSLHQELVHDLTSTLLGSYRDMVVDAGAAFVEFDRGLARISKHVKEELGHNGVIFFLDELILWLSRSSADTGFVENELQKVVKLVEAQHAHRPAPIFSFIARQKNLSEMLGSAVDQEALNDINLSEDYLEDRFDEIQLESRNLPHIANKRLLEPVNTDAASRIEQDFNVKYDQLDAGQRDIMLTNTYEKSDFQRIYPFSPAMVRALVVLSNELQRNRTALDIMQRLLIAHRTTLKLGDILPVGDLWPLIEEGETPNDPARKSLFQSAKNLRHNKIIPYLENQHGVDFNEVRDGGRNNAEFKQFRDDLRLMHTLLVARLASGLPFFESMDAETLKALNPGVEESPIPGGHGGLTRVREKLRKWAADINEIHYQQQPTEEVELRLDSVDVEHILQRASDKDTPHGRRTKIKELLFDWLGIEEPKNPNLRSSYEFAWRGDNRTLEIAYTNVRSRNFDQMEPTSDDRWLLMIDYPFDEQTFTPRDDIRTIEQYSEERGDAWTLGWLPFHLNQDGRNLLGKLVRVDAVLQNFDSYASELPRAKRDVAKNTLQATRQSLRTRLKDTLAIAYGLRPGETSDLVDQDHTFAHLQSLVDGHDPTLKAGLSFDRVLRDFGEEAFSQGYSNAPNLARERLAPRHVKEIHMALRRSMDSGEGAHIEDTSLRRRLKNYAEPLGLGEMGENRFSHDEDFVHEIDRKINIDPENGVAVSDIYSAIDPSKNPKGLAKELLDLIVLAYADHEHMLVTRRGRGLDDPKPGNLRVPVAKRM